MAWRPEEIPPAFLLKTKAGRKNEIERPCRLEDETGTESSRVFEWIEVDEILA